VNCPVCPGKAEIVIGKVKTEFLKVRLTLSVKHYECKKCGEVFFNLGQAAEFERLRNRQYKIATSLSGEEVRRIREKLGLSQAELEQRLGLGSKVVVRWENGKVRLPGPVNALLRILDKNPESLKLLS